MPRKTCTHVYGALMFSHIHSEIAYALVEDMGIPYAEIARQLGVSHVAVLKMMKREGST